MNIMTGVEACATHPEKVVPKSTPTISRSAGPNSSRGGACRCGGPLTASVEELGVKLVK